MTKPVLRLREGAIAFLLVLAAGISLLLMTRIDAIEFSPQKNLFVTAGVILVLASLGPVSDWLDVPGQVLAWNGLGWAVGLAVFGLDNVGSLPLWPIVLVALGLTFWPRWEGSTINAWAIAIAFLGGFAVCWLAWGDVSFSIPAEWTEWL